MPPNNPFETPPTGIDYLNQIATPAPPEKKTSKTTKFFLAFLGLFGILSVALVIFMATRTDNGPTPVGLLVKLQNLQTISKDYHKKIRSTELQSNNSSLTAVLTTANQAIVAPLAAQEINASKNKPTPAQQQPFDKLRETLDEAYLNYRLEEVYIREMSFQLEETLIIMESLHKQTKSKSMKEYLEETYLNIESLHKRFTGMQPVSDPVSG